MFSKKIVFIVLGVCSFYVHAFSQNFVRSTDWKKYRKEVIIQVGVSEFLGDLGGRNRAGTDYSPVDMELVLTRPAISMAYRYKIFKGLNVHTNFNYMLVAGDDKLTKDIYRNNRNLNFKSNIFEFGTRLELAYLSNKVGHRYGIKKTLSRRMKSRSWEVMGFVGIGAFYFNPKGRDPLTGQWVKLKPLHTEGEGLPGGPKNYSRVAICVPVGLVYRVILSKKWSVGAELNYRFTFTDYIDDVHGTYYDKNALLAAYGPQAVRMADPSKGDIPGATAPNADGTGAQRGEHHHDNYMSFQITVGRFITPKRGRARLRSKF
ncbi:MAG: hypothetical protein JST26_18005 [Bacteroidetes bacterium]|nr:hypothetical protein [Bacteroidota bacterium]